MSVPLLALANAEHDRWKIVDRRWILVAVALLIAAGIGFSFGRMRAPSFGGQRTSEPSNTARIWEPITATSSRVTYCLGVPTDSVDLQSRTVPRSRRERGSLNTYDVVTLARSIVPLVPKNGEFRVMSASDTGFAQLREGPFVLIGAFR